MSILQPPPNPYRYAIFSSRLKHSNLRVIHYSVFFQMCRAHGIGFDMKVLNVIFLFACHGLSFYFRGILGGILGAAMFYVLVGKSRHDILFG